MYAFQLNSKRSVLEIVFRDELKNLRIIVNFYFFSTSFIIFKLKFLIILFADN